MLTTSQKTIIDSFDTNLDGNFTNGVQNPDSSQNAAALSGYSTATGSAPLDKNSIRGVFRLVIAAILGLLEDWKVVNPTGQPEPAFKNSFTNTGGFWNSASFYKDPWGRVMLRGHVGGGALNQAIFTLPTGYRPFNTLSFPVLANGALGELRINSGGDVFLSSGATANVSLDGLSFRGDQ